MTEQKELIRVHVQGGSSAYEADDFHVGDQGWLSVWKRTPEGGKHIVVIYAPGQWNVAERCSAA